jgi:hypothetical protein
LIRLLMNAGKMRHEIIEVGKTTVILRVREHRKAKKFAELEFLIDSAEVAGKNE